MFILVVFPVYALRASEAQNLDLEAHLFFKWSDRLALPHRLAVFVGIGMVFTPDCGSGSIQ